MIGIDSEKIIKQWNSYINIIKGIYDIKIIEYLDTLYNLPIVTIDNININKNDLVIYNIYDSDNYLYVYENYLNIPNIFIGALLGLKYTALNGTFILNFGSVAYKQLADIYLILSKYFKEHYLYYPEISNLFKRTGTHAIFKGFKGISDSEYNKLIDILKSIEKIYPNGSNDFNIYDKELRKHFYINRPINSKLAIAHNHIIGFLENKPDDPIYSEIRQFNNERYLKQDIYMNKLLKYINMSIKELESIKIPTQDHITNAILYCRKYNIQIFNKYSKTLQNNLISKTILHDMVGLHEPIFYEFRTPFKNNIAKKNIVNPNFKSISKNKSKSKLFKKIHSSNKKTINKNYKTKNMKKTKTNKLNSAFFYDLFVNSKKTKTIKSSNYKFASRPTKQNKLRRINVSLEDAISYSNNSLIQVGRLIDVRKDFNKTNPTELYDKLKDQLRFYKGWGKAKKGEENRNVQNLDKKVQSLLGDFSISQAWVKMYEIITECKLIPTNRKGIFKSFHICEAPGTFINCINNYIHTKTNYNDFEWKAQSLHPRLADIKDSYGLIKRHRNNWDWGVDGTGDITNIENIKYYAKIAKDMNINLMTSDCGLKMGDPKYYQVAYASYVSILYSLPINGTLLYKILTPIDIPLIWNLIYITYTNFKDMYFFKPVQNSQSREFYIIAKGYLGIDQKILDKLLNIVEKFESGVSFDKNEYDLYNDTYPEEFVIQVQTISERLANNYVNSIERIIYYVDNIDLLGKDYQKHIENYIKEKNEDWIRKYKPMRLDRKFVL